jgi:tetratricopeptide (TPR) repeat protein
VGLSCGSAETSGSAGRADWSLPVRGSKAGGTYSFYLEKHGAGWQLMAAQLSVGDRQVNVAACTPGPAGPAPVACDGALECAQASVVCFQQSDLVCAERFARKACEGGNMPSCGNLADILINEKQDYEEAVRVARKGCAAEDSNSCNNLATALRLQGSLPDAYAAASKACSLGHDVGCSERAQIDLLRGDAEEAKRWAHKALTLGPKRPSKVRRMGHAYLFSGDADSAAKHYALALNLERKDAENDSGIEERAALPQLDLIRDELRALAKVFPDRAEDVERMISRVESMSRSVEAGP